MQLVWACLQCSFSLSFKFPSPQKPRRSCWLLLNFCLQSWHNSWRISVKFSEQISFEMHFENVICSSRSLCLSFWGKLSAKKFVRLFVIEEEQRRMTISNVWNEWWVWEVIIFACTRRRFQFRICHLSRTVCEKGASQCCLCFCVLGGELVRGNAHQFFVLFSNLGTGILSCFSLETKSLSANVRFATLGSVCSFSLFFSFCISLLFLFLFPCAFWHVSCVHGWVPCCCKPVGFLLFRFAGFFPALLFLQFYSDGFLSDWDLRAFLVMYVFWLLYFPLIALLFCISSCVSTGCPACRNRFRILSFFLLSFFGDWRRKGVFVTGKQSSHFCYGNSLFVEPWRWRRLDLARDAWTERERERELPSRRHGVGGFDFASFLHEFQKQSARELNAWDINPVFSQQQMQFNFFSHSSSAAINHKIDCERACRSGTWLRGGA